MSVSWLIEILKELALDFDDIACDVQVFHHSQVVAKDVKNRLIADWIQYISN
jgi:hypothetical protein